MNLFRTAWGIVGVVVAMILLVFLSQIVSSHHLARVEFQKQVDAYLRAKDAYPQQAAAYEQQWAARQVAKRKRDARRRELEAVFTLNLSPEERAELAALQEAEISDLWAPMPMLAKPVPPVGYYDPSPLP